jgi:hypothetical protein
MWFRMSFFGRVSARLARRHTTAPVGPPALTPTPVLAPKPWVWERLATPEERARLLELNDVRTAA